MRTCWLLEWPQLRSGSVPLQSPDLVCGNRERAVLAKEAVVTVLTAMGLRLST